MKFTDLILEVGELVSTSFTSKKIEKNKASYKFKVSNIEFECLIKLLNNNLQLAQNLEEPLNLRFDFHISNLNIFNKMRVKSNSLKLTNLFKPLTTISFITGAVLDFTKNYPFSPVKIKRIILGAKMEYEMDDRRLNIYIHALTKHLNKHKIQFKISKTRKTKFELRKSIEFLEPIEIPIDLK